MTAAGLLSSFHDHEAMGGRAHPSPSTTMAPLSDRAASAVAHTAVVGVAAAGTVLHRRVSRRSRRLAEAIVPTLAVASWAVIRRTERRRPFREEWLNDHDGDTATDAAFLVGSAVPREVGIRVGAAIGRRIGLRVRLDRLPSIVAIPVAVAAYDLFHTLYHRLGHEWGPAWRVHSVHHSPHRLYWFNAFRFHVGELTGDLIGETIVTSVFRLAPHQRAGFDLIRAVYGNLQHANIALDSGPLNRVFSTPDLHRWHHSEIYAEGDTNYGAIVSVWDQLFGSYVDPDRRFTSQLGVGRMPDFPTTWLDLQRVPIDWAAIRERNAETWYAESARSTDAQRGRRRSGRPRHGGVGGWEGSTDRWAGAPG